MKTAFMVLAMTMMVGQFSMAAESADPNSPSIEQKSQASREFEQVKHEEGGCQNAVSVDLNQNTAQPQRANYITPAPKAFGTQAI